MLRGLLAKITRERIITAALACISIGALFLFWYVGTKYRLEFYIRFKNVPTPYEVYQQLTQVGLSNKYLVNIAISVRRENVGRSRRRGAVPSPWGYAVSARTIAPSMPAFEPSAGNVM